MSAAAAGVSNELIAALPSVQRSRVLRDCESVELQFGQILCQSGRPYREVYFPRSGFVSLVIALSGHPPLEVGMIGQEGMLGASLVLGVQQAPWQAIVQGSGSAWRMPVGRLRSLLITAPALQRGLQHYLVQTIAQLAQTLACNRFHEVGPRLARWLLMSHDRAHARPLHFTHQFLADMLGVRRSAISLAAGPMQAQQLIRYRRGEIEVLDRYGLEAIACECYSRLRIGASRPH